MSAFYHSLVDRHVRLLAEEIKAGENWGDDMELTIERHVLSVAMHMDMNAAVVRDDFLEQFASRFGGQSPENYADELYVEEDHCMLTPIQKEIAGLLKSARTKDVFVAGGAALNRMTPRLSDDIDVFGKLPDEVSAAAHRDAGLLSANGFKLEVLKDLPGWVEIIAAKAGEETILQWIWDDELHFLPVQEDAEFGFVLHPADLAVNKVSAAFGRRQARDYVDLVLIDETYAPLGAFIWAMPGKVRRADLTPLEVVEEIRRRAAAHPPELYARIKMADGVDGRRVIERLDGILERAEHYARTGPVEHWGCLIVDHQGRPIEATSEMIAEGKAIAGSPSENGLWPRFAAEAPEWDAGVQVTPSTAGPHHDVEKHDAGGPDLEDDDDLGLGL